MKKTVQTYQKEWYEAMRVIGASTASTPHADKTVIGKIIAVYDKKPGVYRVQVENVAFDAITQYDYKYSKNDTVYITILKGDYSEEKRIVGKVEDLTEELKNFYKTSPLSDLVIDSIKEFETDNSVASGSTIELDLGESYYTDRNKYVGIKFELEAKELGEVSIDYTQDPGLVFEFYDDKNNLVNITAIPLMELTGNLSYAMQGLPFEVVRNIGTHFGDNGKIKSFNTLKVTFNSNGITGGTLTAYIKKLSFGLSASEIAKNVLETTISIPKDEGEEEDKKSTSVISKKIGNIANVDGTQNINLSLSWTFLDEVKKEKIVFNFNNPVDETIYPELTNATIVWQKRTERQSEWINLQDPITATNTSAYSTSDIYHIAVKEKVNPETNGIGYEYDDDYKDLNSEAYGKLPGQYIEYRAILNFGSIESNIVKFENTFNPLTYIPPVKVGGRNLLLNSDEYVENSNYPTQFYNLAITPTVGETYTITLKGQLGEGKQGFYAYNSGDIVELAKLEKMNDLYSATFVWRNETVDPKFVNIYAIPQDVETISIIEWIKLEKGSITTEWSPAPEDPIEYTKTAVGQFDNKVNQLLGIGETVIDDQYIISPYIGGGYLNVTGQNSRVVIDPTNYNEQNSIFQVWKNPDTPNAKMVIGFDENGNAKFDGTVIATAGNIGGCTFNDEGNLIIPQKLLANVINADYIEALDLEVGNQIKMGKDASISWTQVTDQPTIPDDDYITTITENTIKTAEITATKMIVNNLDNGNTIFLADASSGQNKVQIGGFTVSTSSIYYNKKSYNDDFDGVYIGTDGIGLGKGKFYVNNTGAMTCTSGQIAAFTISGNSLRTTKDAPDDGKTGVYLGKTGLGVGQYFYVRNDGALYATGANISGTITASTFKSATNDNSVYLSASALTGQTIGDTSNLSLMLKVGSKFGATDDGTLYASGANISGVLTAGDNSKIAGWIIQNNSDFSYIAPSALEPSEYHFPTTYNGPVLYSNQYVQAIGTSYTEDGEMMIDYQQVYLTPIGIIIQTDSYLQGNDRPYRSSCSGTLWARLGK